MNFSQKDFEFSSVNGSIEPDLHFNITTQMTATVNNTSEFQVTLTNPPALNNVTTPQPNSYSHLLPITENIRKFCNPFLFLVGTIGNLLTILVLSQRKNRHTSTAIFLLFLAISDIMILFTSYVSEWTFTMWKFDFREVNGALCKIHVFCTYFSLQFSSWILVLVTCERAISVINPTKVRLICSRRRGLTGLALLVVFLALFNCHWLVGMVHEYNPYIMRYCAGSSKSYIKFLNEVWPIMDFCVTFALPFLFIAAGNTVIILKITRASSRRSHMVASDQKKNHSSLTVTLVIVNIVFIISMAPASIFLILYAFSIETQDVEQITLAIFIYDVVNILAGLNATLNFILYFLSGSKFRADVKALFCYEKVQKQGVFDGTQKERK